MWSVFPPRLFPYLPFSLELKHSQLSYPLDWGQQQISQCHWPIVNSHLLIGFAIEDAAPPLNESSWLEVSKAGASQPSTPRHDPAKTLVCLTSTICHTPGLIKWLLPTLSTISFTCMGAHTLTRAVGQQRGHDVDWEPTAYKSQSLLLSKSVT